MYVQSSGYSKILRHVDPVWAQCRLPASSRSDGASTNFSPRIFPTVLRQGFPVPRPR